MKLKLLALLLACIASFSTWAQTRTWTGASNTNWANSANWNPADVPTATSNVVIPGGTNAPTIAAGTAAVARTVEVQTGAVLTIEATASLTVNGAKGANLNGTLVSVGFINSGTVNNNGLLTLGNNAGVGQYGLWNQSAFNNTGGSIRINSSTIAGVLNTGTFANTGRMDLGLTATEAAGTLSIISGGFEVTPLFRGGGLDDLSPTPTPPVDNPPPPSDGGGDPDPTPPPPSGGLPFSESVGQRGIQNRNVFNNNTGGQIFIERTTAVGLFNETGSFTNAARITIGANASVGRLGLVNRATFNNNAGGEIIIDRTSGTNSAGLFNEAGTFSNNAARITVGANNPVGEFGLINQATFNNMASAEIRLNNSTKAGLNNFQGTFTNAATITIGPNTNVGQYGLWNEASFNNNTGGVIAIDRSSDAGLFNEKGTFTNAATITVGGTANVGVFGLANLATFNNNAGGDIKIDRSSTEGLRNQTGTFTNRANITIGGTSNVGLYGLSNEALFNNSGGEIKIDRSSGNNSSGLLNLAGTFTNEAKIIIGGTESVGIFGLLNQAVFNNNSGGDLQIDRSSGENSAGLRNQLTFNNAGNITIGGKADVGTLGLFNLNAFNHTAGEIKIDRSSGEENSAGLRNQGTFVNAASITIGATANVGIYGLWNQATFNNNTGGNIQIDRSSGNASAGLLNVIGTFNNAARITIGSISDVGLYGISNLATFNNNSGGEIQIDRSSGENSAGLLNLNGTFTNAANINIGGTASVGVFGLWNFATFNNNGGNISINRTAGSTSAGLRNEVGTFNNAAGITIGDISEVGVYGLWNQAAFNNNAGEIRIDRASTANSTGLFNSANTFTNKAIITIGGTATVGIRGISNGAVFNNEAGEIKIDRTTLEALINTGTFTNTARITIGGIGGSFSQNVGTTGIRNFGVFNNNVGATTTGDISINRATEDGLLNQTGSFTNNGNIAIGRISSTPRGLTNSATFNNNAGEISIDRVNDVGLRNTSSGNFTNRASITVGANSIVGGTLLDNRGTFTNSNCATMFMQSQFFGSVSNTANLNNQGQMTINLVNGHSNTGTFTNNGVLLYPRGNLVPNVVNNKIIVDRGITTNCEGIAAPALQIGGSNDLVVGNTWFADAALSNTAGTYNAATNTFNASLGDGNFQVFFTITDPTGNCARTISVPVTVRVEPPTVGLTASATQITDGQEVTLTATGGVTYRWNNGQTGAEITVTPPVGNTVFTVTATGANGCEASASITISVNDKPILAGVPANATVDELVEFTFTATATDSNVLTFSLVNAPEGAAIDAQSGVFTWTPSEAQGPGVFTFTVKVTDNGVPSLSDEQEITVTVKEVNNAPVLANVPSAMEVDELTELTFTATATDSDIPANELTFSLVNAPAGAGIDAQTGVFTWTPSEAQGPGVFTFSVKVTDNGVPSLSDEQEIVVTVKEVNTAPVLADVPETATVPWGNLLAFTATATDSDLPKNTLTFSLIGAPAGAAINPATGAFTWTPTVAQIGDATFTVRVTDNGMPILSDEQEITVTVSKRLSALVYTGSASAQYSDVANLSAILTDVTNGTPGTPISGKTVNFALGTQSASATTLANGVASQLLVLNQPQAMTQVISTFAGDDLYEGSADNDPFNILREDAEVVYSGLEFFSTTSSTSRNANVEYIATLTDAPDGSRGVITNALATFTGGTAPRTVPVTLLAANNPTVGTARTGLQTETLSQSEFNSGGKTYEVGVTADGNFYQGESNELTLITIAVPGSDFVNGGGHLVMAQSAGSLAATAGTKMNFGFTMRWNRSGNNVQGQANFIFRRMENGVLRTYQIKSNAINTLGTSNVTGGRRADFNTRANLTDITNPAAPISMSGNLDLSVQAFEATDRQFRDQISITLRQGGTLLFSSFWNGSASVMQPLNGGAIKVRSGAAPGKKVSFIEEAASAEVMQPLQVEVFPNPARQNFTLQFNTAMTGEAQINVIDMKGAVLLKRSVPAEDLTNGVVIDISEFQTGLYMIHTITGGKTISTKLMKH